MKDIIEGVKRKLRKRCVILELYVTSNKGCDIFILKDGFKFVRS